MLSGASQPLWNASVCPSNSLCDNAMVCIPADWTAAHIFNKRLGENGSLPNRCQKDLGSVDYISDLVTLLAWPSSTCRAAPRTLCRARLLVQQFAGVVTDWFTAHRKGPRPVFHKGTSKNGAKMTLPRMRDQDCEDCISILVTLWVLKLLLVVWRLSVFVEHVCLHSSSQRGRHNGSHPNTIDRGPLFLKQKKQFNFGKTDIMKPRDQCLEHYISELFFPLILTPLACHAAPLTGGPAANGTMGGSGDYGWASTKSSRPSNMAVAINAHYHGHARSSDQAGGHLPVS